MDTSLRWWDYIHTNESADNHDMWLEASSSGRTLLLCGAGFDPRTMDIPPLVRAAVEGELEIIAVKPSISGEHTSASEQGAANQLRLAELFGDAVQIVDVPMVEDPAATGTLFTRQLQEDYDILMFDCVIIDISAFPSSLYFPLVRLFLQQSRDEVPLGPRFSGNLVVCVSEDPSLDEQIVPTGLAPASILSGFDRMPEDEGTRIWIPILGSGAGEELSAVQRLVQPNEICPVVPFPAREARRADDLILEHQTILISELRLDTRNVIYAAEANPFDLYRQLVELTRRYTRALSPLGDVTVVASEHASKTLSLGVLLAAEEVPIVIAEVRPSGYRFERSDSTRPNLHISSFWLTGTPYQCQTSVEE